jgi:CRP-like cAMP-binding protein
MAPQYPTLICVLLFAEKGAFMTRYTAPDDLQTALKQNCETVRRKKGFVLFRRGDKCFGMFVVLAGKVSLDFGVDSPFARSYGPGALVGLPATLTRRDYSMTATVTDDAELGFCSFDALESLLRERPGLCKQLLVVLGERMAENQQMARALLTKDQQPEQHSVVV